ncbi:MAG: hypothetical protein ACLP59_34635 [Bryobacteraceae bacterium]
MSSDFKAVFVKLKSVFQKQSKRLSVKTDTATEYTLVTKRPSPFPQHKGQPMYFASVRLGKAYVSFHLMPLYMNPPLTQTISPALKKRMQGKTCFNFKSDPDPDLLDQLRQLTEAGYRNWRKKNWL